MDKHLLHTFAMCSMFLASCGSDDVTPGTWVTTPVDPSKPTEFADFTPKEGGVRTRMYITGSNFGTDESKIHVTIGGQKTPVIGSNGSKIFCMLPPRAYDGDIKVVIDDKNGNTVVEYAFEERFTYIPKKVVGTLLRNYNASTGSAPFQDGSFTDGAGLPCSDWMVFDPKPAGGDKIIFTSNYQKGSEGLRTINLTKKEVRTLSTGVRGNKQQCFTFSADGDTLLIADDNGKGNLGDITMANLFYALRTENFTKFRPYNYQACAYSVVYMPDGTVFYTTYPGGRIMKMVRNGGIPNIDTRAHSCFSFQSLEGIGGRQIKMKAHPSGKYVYVFGIYSGIIWKSMYDPVAKVLLTPTTVAGQSAYDNEKLLAEGTGSLARFGNIWSGTFVKNPQYVENHTFGDDYYDFYFADQKGHCIWRITPDGVASIVAGRSNYTVDNKYTGYVEGDPLLEARFNGPRSITYDEEEETFYIGDEGNKCIRYLRTE